MDTNKIFEGFSISHAAILDGTTGAEEVDGDIYGVRTGSLAANTGNFDNTGDDAVLSSWFWIDNATLTIESGYVPFETIALLSGTSIVSSGTTYEIELWDEDSVNQPPRPVLLQVPSKDADGDIRVMKFILYKVQFAPFSFTGPAYKSGLLLSYSGRATLSNKNEKGETLAKRSIGRLVNSPA